MRIHAPLLLAVFSSLTSSAPVKNLPTDSHIFSPRSNEADNGFRDGSRAQIFNSKKGQKNRKDYSALMNKEYSDHLEAVVGRESFEESLRNAQLPPGSNGWRKYTTKTDYAKLMEAPPGVISKFVDPDSLRQSRVNEQARTAPSSENKRYEPYPKTQPVRANAQSEEVAHQVTAPRGSNKQRPGKGGQLSLFDLAEASESKAQAAGMFAEKVKLPPLRLE